MQWQYIATILILVLLRLFVMNEGSLERTRKDEKCRQTFRIIFVFFIAFIIALNIITVMTVVHKLLRATRPTVNF